MADPAPRQIDPFTFNLPTFQCGMLFGAGCAIPADWWWAMVLLATATQAWVCFDQRRQEIANAR